MKEFDKYWNYNNPEETRLKFIELLREGDSQKDLSNHLQLITQIARTHSLQRQFDEAHTLLDDVEKQLPRSVDVAHIRYHLERGRAFNSAGRKTEATEHFKQAESAAEKLQEDFYRIDALHMLAIVGSLKESIGINEAAILCAEQSNQERAKAWLGSLYNNLAWSYFDSSDFEKALSIFLRALAWREQKEQKREIFLAKWCVARTLRALNRINDAIKIQLALAEEMIDTDSPDGYVYEELGELHLLKNDNIYKMYFQFAHNELSKDSWFAKNETKRLNRIKELAKE